MIHRRALADLVAWLSRSTARERMQLPGLDPRREDLALPAGMALLTWMEACDVSTVRYASGSIREGLVIDYLLRHDAAGPGRRIDDLSSDLFGANGVTMLSRPRRVASLSLMKPAKGDA